MVVSVVLLLCVVMVWWFGGGTMFSVVECSVACESVDVYGVCI